jgi:hypothetical protein
MDACHLTYIKNLEEKKTKKKPTESQEFSYFKKPIRTTPINDA